MTEEQTQTFATTHDCIIYLRKNGYLDYGVTIPRSVMELLIGMRYEDTWKWRQQFLSLKAAIEDAGYFVSQRGLDEGALRLLDAGEVWIHGKKRQDKRKQKVSLDHSIMQSTDLSRLDFENAKRHEHQMRRLARIEQHLDEIERSLRHR